VEVLPQPQAPCATGWAAARLRVPVAHIEYFEKADRVAVDHLRAECTLPRLAEGDRIHLRAEKADVEDFRRDQADFRFPCRNTTTYNRF